MGYISDISLTEKSVPIVNEVEIIEEPQIGGVRSNDDDLSVEAVVLIGFGVLLLAICATVSVIFIGCYFINMANKGKTLENAEQELFGYRQKIRNENAQQIMPSASTQISNQMSNTNTSLQIDRIDPSIQQFSPNSWTGMTTTKMTTTNSNNCHNRISIIAPVISVTPDVSALSGNVHIDNNMLNTPPISTRVNGRGSLSHGLSEVIYKSANIHHLSTNENAEIDYDQNVEINKSTILGDLQIKIDNEWMNDIEFDQNEDIEQNVIRQKFEDDEKQIVLETDSYINNQYDVQNDENKKKLHETDHYMKSRKKRKSRKGRKTRKKQKSQSKDVSDEIAAAADENGGTFIKAAYHHNHNQGVTVGSADYDIEDLGVENPYLKRTNTIPLETNDTIQGE